MPTAIVPTRRGVDRILLRATAPVSAYSTAVFRILFGLLGAYGSIRFLSKGWVETLYLNPANHLTYEHFGWVRPWAPFWMYTHVVVVGLAALAVALGFRSRFAALIYVASFGYLELLDGALYLNHYWWMTLAGAWLVVLPVHRTWSIENLWSSKGNRTRKTVPAITVWILRAQLGVVYVFAGLAKLNPDWLGDGNPLGIWLANRSAMPFAGALLATPGVGLVASWAGVLFDCTIIGWLLWPRSRPVAYVAVVVFHTVTGLLFQIGLFPLVMIAGTLVFFPPEWPLEVAKRMRILSRLVHVPEREDIERARACSPLKLHFALPLMVVLILQLVIPLRHFATAGNVRWTEEGYYLSWRVMLTEKTGVLQFEVTDPDTGEVWRVQPELVLADWQARQAAIRSDLLLATAHLVAEDFERRGIRDVEVRADSFVAFNGRPRQRYVDPTIDLAALDRGSSASHWILPLDQLRYD